MVDLSMAMFNNQMVTEKSPETARDHRDTYQILYILWDVSLTIYIYTVYGTLCLSGGWG
jgi:hypothetical protein